MAAEFFEFDENWRDDISLLKYFIEEYNKEPIPHVKVILRTINSEMIEVRGLYADIRGSGYGTKAMNKLIKIADDRNVFLTLKPKVVGRDGLIKFYERFGFKVVDQECWMDRRPNKYYLKKFIASLKLLWNK